MIKALLIDDERDALEVLEWQLKNYCPQVDVVALCVGAGEGVARIKELQPQLVFLDIEMPVMNGFDVLQAFDEPPFAVIFTTAYNQYAIKAIKFAAFDYLVKPIDSSDLQEAVSRFERRGATSIQEQVKRLLQEYGLPQRDGSPASAERVALHSSEGLIMVRPEDIIHCLAVSNYTKIFLSGNVRQVTVSKTLKEVEETLGEQHFYRIHNSHLINISHVQKYVKADGGFIVMSDGQEIPIARNRRDGFMEQFSKL